MIKKHPLQLLIDQGEHQQQDFKFEVNDSKKIARTLSAFANTDGGRLLIGVKDNGHISGIKSEEEYYMIEAASQMYTKPQVDFTATRWNVQGKCVLEIYIAPGNNRPYLAPDKDGKFKAYIRVADENILANEVLVLSWQKKPVSTRSFAKTQQACKSIICLFGTESDHQPESVQPDSSYQNFYSQTDFERLNQHAYSRIYSDRQADPLPDQKRICI